MHGVFTVLLMRDQTILLLTITNWLFLKPHDENSQDPRWTLNKKKENSYKLSQKLKISNHQSDNSNNNSHWICYLINILPTSAIMKID